MSVKTLFSLLIILFFSSGQRVFANEKNTLGLTTITISYSDDRLLERYSPKIAKAYLSLGIRPHFEKLTYNRSNRLSKKYEVDAVLIKGEKNIRPEFHLTKINVPLAKFVQALVCSPDVLCDHSILDEMGQVIGSANSTEVLDEVLGDKPVQIYQLASAKMVINMLKNGRLKYGIAYLRRGDELRFGNLQIASPPLQEDEAYHYVSQKLAPLADELELALKNLQ